MTDKSLKREVNSIDPMFYIPEGVDELEYSEEIPSDLIVTQDDDGNFVFTPINPTQTTYGLATPNIIGIVEQTIRTTKSGAQVVDVVIEVDEIPGASYEVRVNKV